MDRGRSSRRSANAEEFINTFSGWLSRFWRNSHTALHPPRYTSNEDKSIIQILHFSLSVAMIKFNVPPIFNSRSCRDRKERLSFNFITNLFVNIIEILFYKAMVISPLTCRQKVSHSPSGTSQASSQSLHFLLLPAHAAGTRKPRSLLSFPSSVSNKEKHFALHRPTRTERRNSGDELFSCRSCDMACMSCCSWMSNMFCSWINHGLTKRNEELFWTNWLLGIKGLPWVVFFMIDSSARATSSRPVWGLKPVVLNGPPISTVVQLPLWITSISDNRIGTHMCNIVTSLRSHNYQNSFTLLTQYQHWNCNTQIYSSLHSVWRFTVMIPTLRDHEVQEGQTIQIDVRSSRRSSVNWLTMLWGAL